MEKVSFIIPVYNSEQTIGQVVDRILNLYSCCYDLEIILVNDCSKDGSFEVCRSYAQKYKNIKSISLAKNFGQHSAIMAGLKFSTGGYIVLLDDDMQNPPEEVQKLVKKLEEGFDAVFGTREEYKQSFFRKLGSSINNAMFDALLKKDKSLKLSNFLIMKRYIVDEIIKYDGPYPYIHGLILRITRNITHITTQHRERVAGISNYTIYKLLKLWVNGLTNFSVKPLRISIFMGIFLALIGFIFSIYFILQKFLNPDIQMGWTSIMVTVLLLSGIQLISIGMVGEYIGRIFIFQNKSPQYVIKETVNLEIHQMMRSGKGVSDE